ncbi:DUF1338 domain-containing protein [Endozoicomonas sp. SM1973]|uniref:2-oxoadipate dioxygenase/decarboxylase n=1 Tax=Spartinivicinus marinus TaxID=2994442 RepID=A0A853I6E2_9GAMM|nr:DUF1338 domain-containing protein [Spartinivicinus marinus]MCX4029971.1 DUF1338 domain-containing protein [Spartinivicinus marinus]NYZ64785.1 DUF1338 domain-containing protein [Spartinivicinus marinus]
MRKIDPLMNAMWQDYLNLNPDAQKIYQLFSDQNDEQVINDHIALRTFNVAKVSINQVAKPFIEAGYEAAGEYEFKAKKLYAKHFQHEDPNLPKIFISELLVEQLSQETRAIIEYLVEQIPADAVTADDFCFSGRHWNTDYATYQQLLAESEYAAWMSAFGYRPNHFTVYINALKSHQSLEAVNQFLLDQGFKLNTSGGLIKGSPDVYLEQSATLANKTAVQFNDQTVAIPSCFYEFARRYPLPSGELYQGFVAQSADKIFESTDAR